MTYQEVLQYLYDRLAAFHKVGGAAYKPGLENTIRLLAAYRHPQQRYKTIHIAGTNGKGSVSNMLAAVLQSAGYKVGLYTSPHLTDFGERIRVNGEMIQQRYVIDFVESNKELFTEIQPSFFEATMAMAFCYFADQEIDVAVVEVGLGGRLDSTNIIQPELSVVTNISLDHTEFLGDTLEKIALEKAGIIKPNTPVVIGEALPETRLVFETKANEMNAPICFAEEELNVLSAQNVGDKLFVSTSDNETYKIGLTGNYQLKNIVTTLTAIKRLQEIGFSISKKSIQCGLENVVEITGLKGRWQQVGDQPKIILDTGHNVAGIAWVTQQLEKQRYKTLRIVIGLVNDKDISGVLSLLPKVAVYYFTQASISRALSSGKLGQKAGEYGLTGSAYNSVPEAVSKAICDSNPDDLLFIGGSNFVVGEALEYFQK